MDCRLKLHCPKSLILSIVFFGYAAASDRQLTMADSLVSCGFYDDAITEYYRFIFLNPVNPTINEIYSKVGYCYGELEQWDRAGEAMAKAIGSASNDSLKQQRLIDKAVIDLASGKIGEARSEFQLSLNSRYDDNSERASYLLFLSCILDHDWKRALDIYRTSALSGYFRSDSLESLLTKASRAKYKSPNKAVLLSTLIPGAGQIYCGGWRTGLNAFALNGGLGYWTVNSLVRKRYASGAMIFYFLFQRYYKGNLDHSYNLAVLANEEKDNRIEKEIIHLMENAPERDSDIH